MPQAKRMREALDVSGAFDNCFFHTYAAHLLANNLPLPHDLFTFRSISGARSPASQVQARFPDQQSLDVFAEYARYRSDEAPDSPDFPVEKTLVLGFLMREWFATKMFQSQTIPTAEIIDKFKQYKEFRNTGVELEDLLSDNDGVLYTANQKFLEYFSARPKSGQLTTEEKAFEKFFTDASGNSDIALTNYWKTVGYKNYCLLISQPSTKLAYSNVMPVMKMLNQPITIYNAIGNQAIIYRHEGNLAIPKLEIKLNAQEGHYFLLKTEATKPLLNEYAQSFTQYKQEREEILSARDKDLAASTKKSVLVGAICPSGHLSREPFSLLLDKVDQMKRVVDSRHQAERAQQERIGRLEQQQRLRQIEQRVQEQNQRIRERQEIERPQVQQPELHQERALIPIFEQQHNDFKEKVNLLTTKMTDFEIYSERYNKIKTLRDALSVAGDTYFEGTPTRETYLAFKKSCSDAIVVARPVLETHTDSLKIALSVLAIVVTFGGALGIDYLMNGKLTLFSTDSIIKVGEIEDHISDLSPPAA